MNDTFTFNTREKIIVNNKNKLERGEIYTPYSLIEEMFSLLPKDIFKNRLKWLDTSCGRGNFLKVLYNKLIQYNTDKKVDILEQELYGCDISRENIENFKTCIENELDYKREKLNLRCCDFLSDDFCFQNKKIETYDVIVGNPPYNSEGTFKVPTNKTLHKKKDGKAIWKEFIKKSLSILKEDGYLLMYVPSIWLKPDKSNIYFLLNQYQITHLKTFTTTETNHIFGYNAQTPTCYFLLRKKMYQNTNKREISIYDSVTSQYTLYKFTIGEAIPLNYVSIVNKLKPYVKKYGCIKVIKTNMPSKNVSILDEIQVSHPYLNIKTCILEPCIIGDKKRLQTKLIYQYSDKELKYKERKIVMAHKMYGFPYYDKEGLYGISNRDNYVILNYNDEENKCLTKYLQSKLIFILMDITRYRMKYLEKYFFEFIPDVTKIKDVREKCFHTLSSEVQSVDKDNVFTNDYLYSLFGLSSEEIKFIEEYHPRYKMYSMFNSYS